MTKNTKTFVIGFFCKMVSLFKCNMLVLSLNWNFSSFLVLSDKILTKTKILTNNQFLLYKNNFVFLPKQRISPKKSSQKISPKNSSKKILLKNSPRKTKKILNNFSKISLKISNSLFTFYLKAENPFRLVFKRNNGHFGIVLYILITSVWDDQNEQKF